MATNIAIGGNFRTMQARFAGVAKARLQKAVAMGLSDVAFKARDAVKAEMKTVFTNPSNFTLSSVRVKQADPGKLIAEQFAEVYIRDDYPKTNTSPRRYLLAEELGGERGNKRSENALVNFGVLPLGQQTTPAGRPISGPQMTAILSGVRALGEQGYSGNATSETTKRLRRKKVLVTKNTGTQYFIARSKIAEGGMGIFKLVSSGNVKPVLWFTTKRPRYTARFQFGEVVRSTTSEFLNRQIQRALSRLLGGGK